MQPSKEKRHHGHAARDPHKNDGSNSVARTRRPDDEKRLSYDGSNLDARTNTPDVVVAHYLATHTNYSSPVPDSSKWLGEESTNNPSFSPLKYQTASKV
jgi:hypothetical protein